MLLDHDEEVRALALQAAATVHQGKLTLSGSLDLDDPSTTQELVDASSAILMLTSIFASYIEANTHQIIDKYMFQE